MEKPVYPSDALDRYIVRFPKGMRDQLKQTAAANGRTLNAELVHRLQASLDGSYGVPVPPEILKMLKKAAKTSERSLEGELYSRLLESLNGHQDVERYKKKFYEAQALAQARYQELQELNAGKTVPANTIYLLLDSNGYPLSWEEIRTLWGALIRDQGLNVVQAETHVLTPDMESSSSRAKQVVKLAKHLRASGKSAVLKQTPHTSQVPPKDFP